MIAEFEKVYLPLITAVLLFSGFWYVKAYFSYFGISEVTANLTTEYYIQFSFAVLFDVVTLGNVWNTGLFVLLVLVVWFIGRSAERQRDGAWEAEGKTKYFRLPFGLRVVTAAVASFGVIFWVAHDIGTAHACQFLQGETNKRSQATAQYFRDAAASEAWNNSIDKFDLFLAEDAKKTGSQKMSAKQLVEVWRTSDIVYLSSRVASCDQTRIMLKTEASHIPVIRFVLEGA